jgi:hypothetical protein
MKFGSQGNNMNQDVVELYKTIRAEARNLDTNQTRAQAIKQLTSLVLSRISHNGYYHNHNGKMVFGGRSFSNRKFRKFFRRKYNSIGLPAKEMEILNKMITDVVDGLELSQANLKNLQDTVQDMERCAVRVKSINQSCDEIVAELERISNFVGTGEWASTI